MVNQDTNEKLDAKSTVDDLFLQVVNGEKSVADGIPKIVDTLQKANKPIKTICYELEAIAEVLRSEGMENEALFCSFESEAIKEEMAYGKRDFKDYDYFPFAYLKQEILLWDMETHPKAFSCHTHIGEINATDYSSGGYWIGVLQEADTYLVTATDTSGFSNTVVFSKEEFYALTRRKFEEKAFYALKEHDVENKDQEGKAQEGKVQEDLEDYER